MVRHGPVNTDADTPPADAELPEVAPEDGAAEKLPTRIMLVTDAWEPQVNGVVRTLSSTMRELKAMGCKIEVVSPADYPNTVPLITYSEIRLALGAREDVEDRFLAFAPDAVHIATEGTLGWDARAICLKHKFPFTTSYHTQFPEYVTARFRWIPLWAGYRYMHAFHDKSGRVMVATPTMQKQLQLQGFRNTRSGAAASMSSFSIPRSAASTAASILLICRGQFSSMWAAYRLRKTSKHF